METLNLIVFEVVQCVAIFVYYLKNFTKAKVTSRYFALITIGIVVISIFGFTKYQYFVSLFVCTILYIVLPLVSVIGIPNKSKIYYFYVHCGCSIIYK